MEHTQPQGKEKAMLVAVFKKAGAHEDQLDELAALAETAGAEVVHQAVQHLPHPDRATYIGSGKTQELAAMAAELELDLVIFNDALSPSQLGKLNDRFPCRVLDRNQLILDIFAQRALSREGRLQVELAQLTYLLPRLAGSTRHLSRQEGRIGTRGPGESKLEINRRRLRNRIGMLREEIDELRQHRRVQRRRRQRNGIPQAALVGYTNAGKTTLMNALTGSVLLAEDKLFATLDTTTRRCQLDDGRYALLSDTVGFIQNLPSHLVAAFRATLEELEEADLLVHVVDLSREDYREQMEAVQQVLDDLAITRPVLQVFNKLDLLPPGAGEHLLHEYAGSVAIAAEKGLGLEQLLRRMQELLYAERTRYTVLIPYAESSLLEPIYRFAKIFCRSEGAEGATLEIESDAALAERLMKYRIAEGDHTWTVIATS